MRHNNRHASRIGLTGLLITLGLNLIGDLALQQPAANPLGDQWWSSWFPLYIVWFVFLLLGGIQYIMLRQHEGKQP